MKGDEIMSARKEHPLNYNRMTDDEFNDVIDPGIKQALSGEVFSSEIVNDELSKLFTTPNEETLKAMQETEDMIAHPEKYKRYNDIDELFRDLMS